MNALSIRQPRAWAVLHAGKRIVDVDWSAPPTVRGAVLLHAQGGCTPREYAAQCAWMQDYRRAAARGSRFAAEHPDLPALPPLAELAEEAIVGRALLVDVLLPTAEGLRLALVLSHVQAVEPFPYALARPDGLVDVPDDVAHGLRPLARPGG